MVWNINYCKYRACYNFTAYLSIKNKPSTYYKEPNESMSENIPEGMTIYQFAIKQAMNRADR